MKGLLSYCGMLADLEDIFQCRVDLVIKNAIKDKQFLEAIGKNGVKLYERQKVRTDHTTKGASVLSFLYCY